MTLSVPLVLAVWVMWKHLKLKQKERSSDAESTAEGAKLDNEQEDVGVEHG